MNRYSLVAIADSPTNGTYDLFINGTEVISDTAYTLGSGGSNNEINWQNRNITGGDDRYDNLVVSTFIIPPEGTVIVIR